MLFGYSEFPRETNFRFSTTRAPCPSLVRAAVYIVFLQYFHLIKYLSDIKNNIWYYFDYLIINLSAFDV